MVSEVTDLRAFSFVGFLSVLISVFEVVFDNLIPTLAQKATQFTRR